MTEPAVTPAPAHAVDPATPIAPALTDSQQAVADNDYTRFEALERDVPKPGTVPKATVPASTPAAAPAVKPIEDARVVSKRQQQINDYERRIATQEAELTQLRMPMPPAAPRSDPPAQTAPATLAETVTRPDIFRPALNDQDFFAKFPDASIGDYTRYVSRHDRGVEQLDAGRRAVDARIARDAASVVTSAQERLHVAVQADPTFIARVSPVLALATREQAMAQGRQPGPENDFASELLGSESLPQLLDHLASHPDDLAKVKTLPTRGAVSRFIGRLEALVSGTPALAPAAISSVTKTLTDAPAPPRTLGSRPTTPADPMRSAVASGDYAAFERIEREQLAASRVRLR